MHTPYSNVVNGGLIDFQDTSFMHAPVQSSMILPSSQQGQVYYVNQQAQPVFSQPTPHMFASPQPVFAPAQTSQPVFAPQPAQPMFSAPQAAQPMFSAPQAAQPMFSAPQAAQPGQCFTGPPSFVHFNGQTYKPVEEPTVGAEPAKLEAADMRGLERKIEERVHDKVNEFMERSRSKKDRAIESSAYHAELAKLNSGLRRGGKSRS